MVSSKSIFWPVRGAAISAEHRIVWAAQSLCVSAGISAVYVTSNHEAYHLGSAVSISDDSSLLNKIYM